MVLPTPEPVHPELSLSALYRTEAEFVWRTIRYLGVGKDDAEDVAHEVFIVVGRRIGDYDPARSIRSWIAGISRRVVMHHHRSRARHRRKVAAFEPTALGVTEPEVLPDALLEQREAAAFLEQFLEGLDPDRREVFVLCDLEGLSAPEVAEITESKVNTVYSRLRTAREGLRKSIDRLEKTRRREDG